MVSAKCSDESTRVVAKTPAMRLLKRSIMPLVCVSSWFNQAMFDVVGAQTRSKAWAPVGWRSPAAQRRSVNALPLAVRTWVILKGALSIRRLRKPLAAVADLFLEDFYVDPAGGAINSGEQVAALVLVRHLRQVLHIHVHKAGCIRFEGLHRRLGAVLLQSQRLEVRNPVAAQTAVQTRARDLGWRTRGSPPAGHPGAAGGSHAKRHHPRASWAALRVVWRRLGRCEASSVPSRWRHFATVWRLRW